MLLVLKGVQIVMVSCVVFEIQSLKFSNFSAKKDQILNKINIAHLELYITLHGLPPKNASCRATL